MPMGKILIYYIIINKRLKKMKINTYTFGFANKDPRNHQFKKKLGNKELCQNIQK